MIPQDVHTAFDALLDAARVGNIVLMQMTDDAGRQRYVIAISERDDGDAALTPIAAMLNASERLRPGWTN